MPDERLDSEIEVIPDEDFVFMRAYKDRIKDGVPRPSAFEAHGGGLSVDWDRYATPEQTRARGKNAQHNAVVSMGVGAIRALSCSPEVVHAPLPENKAHSHVGIPEDPAVELELRIKLSRLAVVVIPILP